MLIPLTTIFAPNTTITVGFIDIRYAMTSDKLINLSVQLLDGYQKPIQLPQPVRQMTIDEKTTFLAVAATLGETPVQLLARAAAPYISSAFGITYTTT